MIGFVLCASIVSVVLFIAYCIDCVDHDSFLLITVLAGLLALYNVAIVVCCMTILFDDSDVVVLNRKQLIEHYQRVQKASVAVDTPKSFKERVK